MRGVRLFSQLPALADDTGYSQVSYYFVLALYILSFPGIFSLVTRSVKSKVVRKTYEIAGPAATGGRPTREVAGDIVAFFQVCSRISLPKQATAYAGRRDVKRFVPSLDLPMFPFVATLAGQQLQDR